MHTTGTGGTAYMGEHRLLQHIAIGEHPSGLDWSPPTGDELDVEGCEQGAVYYSRAGCDVIGTVCVCRAGVTAHMGEHRSLQHITKSLAGSKSPLQSKYD